MPTETIVAGVEDALSRLDNLTEDAKDDIRSRVASTIQSTPRLESNLSREELRALKRLRNDDTIVILPADKGRVTVVMDKSEYFDKMNHLVEDRKTYKELDSDPTPALVRRLNNKLLELEKKKHLNGYQYKRLRCSAPQSPKLYGLPKLHKPQIPMRPIVSFCGSPTYQLSKYLTSILQPLTNASRHKLQSTVDFINAIKTIRLPDNYKLVSFDVKSLFTSIPLQLALDCTEALLDSTDTDTTLPMPTCEIMVLLKLCLESTFFQFNGKHYKQLHGTAMGSPVSVVVAEIVMQKIEKEALASYDLTLPFWFRYVDDTITALPSEHIDAFHIHLNQLNHHIQFTRELEKEGKIPFLDCLISRHNNMLRTTVYRKPTNTDRLLDQSSYNPTSHKATTIKTLTRRAQLVCDSADSLKHETKHLKHMFHKNNYSEKFFYTNTYRPSEPKDNPVETASVPKAYISLPYVRGTSETISRILQPHNIRVAHRPISTLRQILTKVKDRDSPNDRLGAIYKISCNDCEATYVGETGRSFNIRCGEHRSAVDKHDNRNNIAMHHTKTGHSINWDSGKCISFCSNKKQRLILESWFTKLEREPLNRSVKLPTPYNRLVNQTNRQSCRRRTDAL